MTEKPRKTRGRRGLARGLEALVAERTNIPATPGATPSPGSGTPRPEPDRTVAIIDLIPNPFQPRTDFEPAALAALAESLRQSGMLQPILARPDPDQPGRYQILAGERRWRAAQQAGLHRVPIWVRPATDEDAAALALVENMQRADLNAIEEALGLSRLMAEFGFTQARAAAIVNRSRSYVANAVRLLSLPDAVRTMVRSGDLSAGSARPLVGRGDAVALARLIVRRGLNARAVERLVRSRDQGRDPSPPDPNLQALERELEEVLGLDVRVRDGQRGGEVRIRYRSAAQRDALLERLRSR